MSEELNYTSGADKEILYREIIPQIRSLLSDENNLTANLANVCAVLKEVFDWLWVGAYMKDQNDLVLGPFQGPLACTRIPFSKGVCGTAYTQKKTIIVPDVEKFPGHIACSAESRSEIVVPAIAENQSVVFVLDLDSKSLNDFDSTDQRYLEEVVGLILKNSALPVQ